MGHLSTLGGGTSFHPFKGWARQVLPCLEGGGGGGGAKTFKPAIFNFFSSPHPHN